MKAQPGYVKLLRHAVTHLKCCVLDAKARQLELAPDAETDSACGVMSMVAMAHACAWSLGCSLASNNIPREQREEILVGLLKEMRAQFQDGVSKPGEGVMY